MIRGIHVEVSKKNVKSKGHNSDKSTCTCRPINMLSLISSLSMSASIVCENCWHGRTGKFIERKERHNILDRIIVRHKRYTVYYTCKTWWAHIVYENNGKSLKWPKLTWLLHPLGWSPPVCSFLTLYCLSELHPVSAFLAVKKNQPNKHNDWYDTVTHKTWQKFANYSNKFTVMLITKYNKNTTLVYPSLTLSFKLGNLYAILSTVKHGLHGACL